jgi:hypothetical protein
MQTDQKLAAQLIKKWRLNPPKRGVGMLIPIKTLRTDITALLTQVRLRAYNKGYDDGFSDGMSSEGL